MIVNLFVNGVEQRKIEMDPAAFALLEVAGMVRIDRENYSVTHRYIDLVMRENEVQATVRAAIYLTRLT